MNALPKTQALVILDDQGTNPLYFRKSYSEKDSYDDRKAIALAKATQVTEQASLEIGVPFWFLSKEARWFLYKAKKTTVARFLETLYFNRFTHGWLTTQDAADITGWSNHSCRRVLIQLQEYLEEKAWLIKKRRLGVLFAEFFTSLGNKSMKKSAKNSPHKKGAGSGEPRGPKKKLYFVPHRLMLNYLSARVTYYAFDLKALESNKYYNACIAKMDVAGKSVYLPLWSEANRLQISVPTLRRWHEITNVGRKPWIIAIELMPEDIAALPENSRELSQVMRERKQWFGSVHNEAGYRRLAHKDSILGRTPSKAHYRATGEFLEPGPLEGTLYYDQRKGTILTDLGGWVYQVKNSQ